MQHLIPAGRFGVQQIADSADSLQLHSLVPSRPALIFGQNGGLPVYRTVGGPVLGYRWTTQSPANHAERSLASLRSHGSIVGRRSGSGMF